MPLRTPSFKTIRKAGLAMFSLIFGAGNIIYPILVGTSSGKDHFFVGMLGFFITGIMIPVIGIIAIVLFDGDYYAFFKRLGKAPGHMLIFVCMLMLGPLIATPRIINLSYLVLHEFIPVSFYIFLPIFLCIIFISSLELERAVSLLGNFISPLLLVALLFVAVQALWQIRTPMPVSANVWDIFFENVHRGYETLDLIAVMFFSSTILIILKKSMGKANRKSQYRDVVKAGLKAGLISIGLLACAYVLLAVIGLYHTHGLMGNNELELLKEILFRFLNGYSAIIIGAVLLLACLSTIIGYTITVGTYMQETLFQKKISYVSSLLVFLIASIPFSLFGIELVLSIARGPIVYIAYPVMIVLCLFNILYKTYKVELIKTPVLLTTIGATLIYFWSYITDYLI